MQKNSPFVPIYLYIWGFQENQKIFSRLRKKSAPSSLYIEQEALKNLAP